MLIKEFFESSSEQRTKIMAEIDKISEEQKNNMCPESGDPIDKNKHLHIKERQIVLAKKHGRHNGFCDGYVAGLKAALATPEDAKKMIAVDEKFIAEITKEE